MENIKTSYCGPEAKLYDSKRFTSPSGRRLHKAEVDLVFWMLQRVPVEKKILEVGCGTGRIIIEVADAGYHADGADASADMLDILRDKLRTRKSGRNSESVGLMTCEAAQLPIPDNTYDAVYSVRLLNQTDSPEYALSVVDEMVRVTKPSGYILVEFVNFFRPRWAAANRKTVRLRPSEVIKRGTDTGTRVVGVRGAFFLSMQAYTLCPPILLPLLDNLDRFLSRCFPRLSARTYVLFQKYSPADLRC